MSYLIALQDKLQAVAHEVFLHDAYFERVDFINTNKNARIFLRRIIGRAREEPFYLEISNRQLARLVGSSRTRVFMQWFRYNVRLSAESRRARFFLNQLILLNALEDLSEPQASQNEEVNVSQIDWPSDETQAVWRQRVNVIQECARNEGPRIENVTDALEILRWMQDAYFISRNNSILSSSSSSDDTSASNVMEDVTDERTVNDELSLALESLCLNGPPVIVTDTSADICDGKYLPDFGACHQFNEESWLEDNI